MKYLSLFCIALVILNFTSCSKKDSPEPEKIPTNYSVTFQPSNGIDAGIDTYQPTKNFGTNPNLWANAWTISSVAHKWRGLLRFDYSSIPSGSKIKKAQLTLYADTTNVLAGMSAGHSTLSGSNSWYVKRVTSSWDENTVVWNTQPTTDNINQISLPSSTSFDQSYTVDVTAMVKDEFENPASYFGFMIMLQNETPYKNLKFCSSDHIYSALHPQLVVEYEN